MITALTTFAAENAEATEAVVGDEWQKVFGEKNVKVNLYERDKLINGDIIHDFFKSIKINKVYAAYGYMLNKFRIKYPGFKFNRDQLKILVDLTTYKGHIPQGTPTSPALSNIICRQMDRELEALAIKNDLRFTRYVDDLAFSHKNKTFMISEVIKQIKAILKFDQFKLNNKKTRVLRPHKRMCITGVVINDKLSVPKYVWRNVRAQLHNLIKNQGTLSLEDYQKLRGKIEWIGLFRPNLKTTYLEQLGKVTLII